VSAAGSWVPGADRSAWPLATLPYAIGGPPGEAPGPLVRIGHQALDLRALAAAGHLDAALPDAVARFAGDTLNAFLAAGTRAWAAVRARLEALLAVGSPEAEALAPLLRPVDALALRLPFAVADYVDFYSSREHATNLGKLFRPEGQPLLPNWHHLPVGYHGRAGTIVPSGTPVRRPCGQSCEPGEAAPRFGPSRRLDFELEVGFVVGVGSPLGERVPAARAHEHLFGLVLLNDWSARDVQAWEYQPLGPFLGKSFATSISPWVVPLAALEGARVPGPVQDPPVLEYLRVAEPRGLDLELEVGLRTQAMAAAGAPHEVVSATSLRHLYWSRAQHVAHATANGAALRTGDLHASGTVSGPGPGELGSLIELAWNGARPLRVGDGEQRSFLQDGDSVLLRGWARTAAGERVSVGEVEGSVLPALAP
jgi:fumarylacetoacetase